MRQALEVQLGPGEIPHSIEKKHLACSLLGVLRGGAIPRERVSPMNGMTAIFFFGGIKNFSKWIDFMDAIACNNACR